MVLSYSATEVVFFPLNSFASVLSQVHALLTDVTASQVECKNLGPTYQWHKSKYNTSLNTIKYKTEV